MKPREPEIDQTEAGSELPVMRGTVGSAESLLRRSFVMQLAPDCELANGGLRGRVQQLATSDGGNFESVEALLAILRRIFSDDPQHQNHQQDPEKGGGNP